MVYFEPVTRMRDINLKGKYVPATAAYRKLKNAQDMKCATYIYGATGFGKTRLLQEFLDSKPSVWIDAEAKVWDMEDIEENRQSAGEPLAVVIDNLQSLDYSAHADVIAKLIAREDIWLILLGRMQTPQWMIQYIADGKLMIIPEECLRLTADEIGRIAKNNSLQLSAENVEILASATEGNALVIATGIQMIKEGNGVDGDLIPGLQAIFRRHLETRIIPHWNVDVQEFLMKLSVVDEFTLPLAVMITGDDQAAKMLDEVTAVGNFLTCSDGIYCMRPVLLEALRSKALKYFGLGEYRIYICNAGLFYETQDELIKALKMYEKAEKKENIRSLLIRNGRRHVGAGFYYELRKYYMALADSEVETSPILMSAMSILYSILMNPEKSEYWYNKLKSYSKQVTAAEKTEAEMLTLYLDIALPHRGAAGMVEIMKHSFVLLKGGNMRLPDFSVTNNCPSAMNGGKDFCEWSKSDQLLADTIGKILEHICGSMGRGLVHVALCESFYEKGGRDSEVSHQAMLSQMDVEGGGTKEILFVAVGIQTRLSMLNGNRVTAFQIMDAFEEHLADDCSEALRRNYNAFRCRIALMSGDTQTATKWMDEAPNEHTEFYTLDRYRYMTKVLCYLSLNKNEEAISLLSRIRYYAENYHRNYIFLEAGLLLAVAYRRQGMEWKQLMIDTLNGLSDYQFVRIISEKGAGLLPLLKEIKKDFLAQKKADQDWFKRVINETEMVAGRYPGYLNSSMAQPSEFSETALSILRMQAAGQSIKEIAAELNMSERTIKYHAAENYRKLGAKGKTDAVQTARSINLI